MSTENNHVRMIFRPKKYSMDAMCCRTCPSRATLWQPTNCTKCKLGTNVHKIHDQACSH